MVDQPKRGDAGQASVAQEISTKTQDQAWFTQFRMGCWPNFNEGSKFPQDEFKKMIKKPITIYMEDYIPDKVGTLDLHAENFWAMVLADSRQFVYEGHFEYMLKTYK